MWIDGRSHKKRKCLICRKSFISRGLDHKLCSTKCMGLWQTKNGTKRGANNGQWKGGRFLTPQGYIFVLNKKHPFSNKAGYVLEHRLFMERNIGRYLKPDEVVHHINGIKSDNRLENLRLMSHREHSSLTGKEREYKSTSGLRGVSWDKSRQKWVAYIREQGKVRNLGRFSKKEDAVKVRKEAEAL